MLGGYHGEPFRGAGWGSSPYWGGYCNHGNVLFPTWHRVYVLKLEEALQSMPGCERRHAAVLGRDRRRLPDEGHSRGR